MAKKKGKSAKAGKASQQPSMAFEAPPSYGPLKDEMQRLITALTIIAEHGQDQNGPLAPEQIQMAKDAVKTLTAGQMLFDCPQTMIPYGG